MEKLKQNPNWVYWRLEDIPGRKKPAKVPYCSSNGLMARASVTNPEHWRMYAELRKLGDMPNFGYVFDGAGVVGIDIDHCVIDGVIKPEAEKLIAFFNSYTEFSQSGQGLHIIVEGKKQDCWKSRFKMHGLDIEVYDTARYFAITFNCYSNKQTVYNRQDQLNELFANLDSDQQQQQQQQQQPPQQAPIHGVDEIIEKCRGARNSDKFNRLFSGDWQSDYPSQSEADLAMCSMIAFYSKDESVIDAVMRQSGLMRNKWDNNTVYRNNTISLAIKNCMGGYNMNNNSGLREKALAKCKNKEQQPEFVDLKIEEILKLSEKAWQVSILPSSLGLVGNLPVVEWIAEKLVEDFDDDANIVKIPAWLVEKIVKKYSE